MTELAAEANVEAAFSTVAVPEPAVPSFVTMTGLRMAGTAESVNISAAAPKPTTGLLPGSFDTSPRTRRKGKARQ